MGFLFWFCIPPPPPPPLCHTHNFVTHHLSHTQLCHTHHLSHTNLSHTISSDNFVTHHLSHPTLSDTTMSHHLSHTTLSHTHTPSFTPNFVRHNFVTHHLSHTQLCHTHNFVTHHLSHTILSWQAWLLRQWAGSGGALWRAWSPVTPGYFAWQVWHLATLTCILQGRRGTWRHPPSLCVAGVALGRIHLHFAWQAWHWLTSTFVLRGTRGRLALVVRLGALGRRWRRGTLRGRRSTWRHPPSFRMAGVALGDIQLGFAWQVWHLATSTFASRGRRGTGWHLPWFCVAGVALAALGWLWWHAWARLVAGDAAVLCVAGVALGDIHLRFACQAWHLATSTFAWQAWPWLTSTFVLRGRRGTCGTGLALVACFGALGRRWRRGTLRGRHGTWRGRRGTWRHPPHFAWQAWHLVWSTFTLRWDLATSTWNLPSLCVAGVERSWSYAGTFTFWKRCWHVFACFALAQRGKRPCACLIKTFWKRCWHVFQEAAHCIHVLYYPGQVLFSSFMVVEPVAVGQAWLSSEFVVVSVSFSMLLI